jgi:hypothetical protein
MDGMPPMDVPCSSFEVVGQEAGAARRRGRGRGARSERTRGTPGGTAGWGDDYAALVEEDRLFVRVVARPHRPGPAPDAGAPPGAVTAAFRAAFRAVWGRLPGPDRDRLRGYWDDPREPGLFADLPPTPRPKPLIQVADADPRSPASQVCTRFGTALTFPAAVAAGPPDRLRYEIARALAQALRHATRAHWRLMNRVIEHPLARWEKRQRAGVTDAARDEKLDQLEAEYLRAYEAELAAIVRRWGIAPPDGAGGDRGTGRERDEG